MDQATLTGTINVASKLSLFLAELKRRKVYRVAAIYAAVGAAISLAVPDLFGALLLPGWATRLVIVLIAIGFPIALVLAWAYEVRPEEAQPPEAAQEETAPPPVNVPKDDSRPSVAVLPFTNLSADPENEYFSDGITFDIINHLTKIAGLKVISRTSIMRFKATDQPLRRIGEELGIENIVEGEVQRVGDRVRISAQLVNARTDEHLWAEQYDREMVDVWVANTSSGSSNGPSGCRWAPGRWDAEGAGKLIGEPDGPPDGPDPPWAVEGRGACTRQAHPSSIRRRSKNFGGPRGQAASRRPYR